MTAQNASTIVCGPWHVSEHASNERVRFELVPSGQLASAAGTSLSVLVGRMRCSGDLDRTVVGGDATDRMVGARRLHVDQRIGGAEDSNGFCELLDFGCIHADERRRLRPGRRHDARRDRQPGDFSAADANRAAGGAHPVQCRRTTGGDVGVRSRVLLRVRVSAPVRAPIGLEFVGPWLLLFAGLYFVLNTFAIAVAIALHERANPFAIWRAYFQNLWLTFMGGALGAGFVVFALQGGSYAVVVFSAPLLLALILHFAYRNSTGRVADQLHHLAEVNRLHLSTIEALAHAIDAKDAVTHGHIRRVQSMAVALAARVGLDDQAGGPRDRGRRTVARYRQARRARSTFSTSRASSRLPSSNA